MTISAKSTKWSDSPWIAVADQEPPFGETILATDGYVRLFARYERGALGHPRKFVERGGWQFPGVTHWMPIPPLPETA
jgi:hypothetical protein